MLNINSTQNIQIPQLHYVKLTFGYVKIYNIKNLTQKF